MRPWFEVEDMQFVGRCAFLKRACQRNNVGDLFALHDSENDAQNAFAGAIR